MLGLRLQIAHARSESEFDAALESLVQKRIAALLVFPDTLFISGRRELASLMMHRRIPSIYSNRLYAEAGGLMSYGSSPSDVYRQLGGYTGRVLKGEKPADLPILQTTKFELVINRAAAQALGLTIPQSVLLRADELIQ